MRGRALGFERANGKTLEKSEGGTQPTTTDAQGRSFEVQAAAGPRSTPRNAGEKNGVRVFAPDRYRYVGLTLAKAVVARPGAGARGVGHQAGHGAPVNPHISRPDRCP